MNEEIPDSFLKLLKPAPLPAAMWARLAEPPARPARDHRQPHRWRVRAAALLPIAAAVAIGIGIVMQRQAPEFVAPLASGGTVTVRHHEKNLLKSERVRLFEVDGGYWELVQQQWREQSTIGSNDSPVLIRTSVIRNTLVCSPVKFD